MSVGRPRWTWRSTCSITCWNWDARAPSASLDPGRGWGQCARTHDPCTTLAPALSGAARAQDWRAGSSRPAARLGPAGVQVLRLLETFRLEDVHAAVREALRLGALGFDAVKHL